jgi:phosphate transport system substrate-binding protein
MKRLKKLLGPAILAGMLLSAGMAWSASLNGAGASFPYPLYSKWFYEYNKQTSVQINYQSIGSGGGIRQLIAHTVDFGASDAPMTPEQMSQVGGPVIHLPTVAGAVVVAYNLEGVKHLKLTADVLSGIFMGKISKWNDSAIEELNPNADLPDVKITVAHRSDGSGTSNIFTNYLTKVNMEWASSVGFGTAVKWPCGVGGKGNEGVAGLIQQIPGAIGYVELAYALKNDLSFAVMKNKSGKFVKASEASTTAAMAGALKSMPSDFRVMITNASGADAYPICGFTWLLIYQKYDNAKKGKAMVDFLKWYLAEGMDDALKLHYAPLPVSLISKVRAKIKTIQY